MCRVKAIASSVERLLRYANCSGSSEAGSTEQMCSLTSFSKHLLKMGVRATGLQSFKHVILFFFGMGTMVDLKHEGTTDRERERLKMSVKFNNNMLPIHSNIDEYLSFRLRGLRSHLMCFTDSGFVKQINN